MITHNGITKSLTDWAAINDMSALILIKRLEKYSIENSLNKEYKPSKRMKAKFKVKEPSAFCMMLAPPESLI